MSLTKEQILEEVKNIMSFLDMFIDNKIDVTTFEHLLQRDEVGQIVWKYLNNEPVKNAKEFYQEFDKIIGYKKIIIVDKLNAIKNPLLLKKISIQNSANMMVLNLITQNNAQFSFMVNKDTMPSILHFLLNAFIGDGNVTLSKEKLNQIYSTFKQMEIQIKDLLNYFSEVINDGTNSSTKKTNE